MSPSDSRAEDGWPGWFRAGVPVFRNRGPGQGQAAEAEGPGTRGGGPGVLDSLAVINPWDRQLRAGVWAATAVAIGVAAIEAVLHLLLGWGAWGICGWLLPRACGFL